MNNWHVFDGGNLVASFDNAKEAIDLTEKLSDDAFIMGGDPQSWCANTAGYHETETA